MAVSPPPLDVDDLTRFLVELKFNNTKAWFDAQRPRYAALRAGFTAFVADVIARVAAFDPAVADVRAKDTLFRIHRDVRFSHDKAPYKTTFSAAIAPGGRRSKAPLYYLQIGADESFAAGGLYFPEPAELAGIRRFVERFPARADALLADEDLARHFGGLSGEGKLTRFPRGFAGGSELLKHKSFTVGAPLDPAAPDLAGEAAERFRRMGPLHAWLRDALAYRA